MFLFVLSASRVISLLLFVLHIESLHSFCLYSLQTFLFVLYKPFCLYSLQNCAFCGVAFLLLTLLCTEMLLAVHLKLRSPGIHELKKVQPKRTSTRGSQGFDPIAPVAQQIREETWLLCFDEFQVQLRVGHSLCKHVPYFSDYRQNFF